MIIPESNLNFDFLNNIQVAKFDNTKYYEKYFKAMTHSKGVDFIFIANDSLTLMEVKNCSGNENNCRWRIFPNNSKRDTTSTTVATEDRDSLDIEIPLKVAMTLSCLFGANSQPDMQEHSSILKPYFTYLASRQVSQGDHKIKIILFLEGNFSTHSISQKMVMKTLTDNIKKQLSWLNCNVIVENKATHRGSVFSVS